MGQDNDVPRRINGVEGAAGETIISGGPGVVETWGHDAAVCPSGFIGMWHGTIANIPAGWVICDGNNSTPNLLTKFVQGVATALTDPGAIGGEATHTLSVAELASHSHSVLANTNMAGGAYLSKLSLTGVAYNTSSAGSNSAHENEPTFYDVAFLMKT